MLLGSVCVQSSVIRNVREVNGDNNCEDFCPRDLVKRRQETVTGCDGMFPSGGVTVGAKGNVHRLCL